MEKVLILSESFVAGDAVTGLNLFSKWDKSKLFCASGRDDFFADNFNECYRIGDEEMRYCFPLNLICHSFKSVVISSSGYKPETKVAVGKTTSWYKHIIRCCLQYTGLYQRRLRYLMSESFAKWVKSINPTYVYTSAGSYNMACFVVEFMRVFPDIKIILHCYDDWTEPNFMTVTEKYSKDCKKILKKLIDSAYVVCGTSNKMAHDYSVIYNRKFISIPNPVKKIEINEVHRSLNVVFLGKIGNHNYTSILLVAQALSEMEKEDGVSLSFDIYTEIDPVRKEHINDTYSRCSFHSWVGREEVLKLVCCSSILLLPITINNQTKKFAKYSMSTKMAEYLSSGTPVLYIGPNDIAMTEILINNDCAYVVDENDVEMVKTSIRSILNDKCKLQSKLLNASRLFQEEFSDKSVLKKFQMILDDPNE